MKYPFLKATWLTTLLLLALATHAQHFDWVKSYSGYEPTGRFWNYIVGSVTDSHGNLYVACQFANGATIDGQDLLPFTPYGGGVDNPNAAIIKFSPDGHVVWKKVLHANQYSPCSITGMHLIGDSSLMFMGAVRIPKATGSYLYFLDTLITKENYTFLGQQNNIGIDLATLMVTLDLDGNTIEHHILQIAYIDAQGRLITLDRQDGYPGHSDIIVASHLQQGPFQVDNYGNIYIAHLPIDKVSILNDTTYTYASVENGLLSGVVFIIDGELRFHIYPQNTPSAYNYRLLKFSQHFDTLLHFQYLFDGDMSWANVVTFGKMQIDSDGNLYVFNDLNPDREAWCNVKDASFPPLHVNGSTKAFLIKYDSLLNPIFLKQIEYGESDTSFSISRYSSFNAVCIDEDSSALFLSATIDNPGESFYIDNTEINLSGNAIILRFDKETGQYISHGAALSTTRTSMRGRLPNYSGIACGNNRVFTPVAYMNDIQLGDSIFNGTPYRAGSGLCVWDYQGSLIQYIDFGSSSSTYETSSSICVTDSILYICGYTSSNMTFGDHPLVSTGNSMAYIAKYVDRGFDTIYSHSSDNMSISNETLIQNIDVFPNPTNSFINFTLQNDEVVLNCRISSLSGFARTIENPTTEINLGSYPSGMYFIEVETNKNVYKQKIIKL